MLDSLPITILPKEKGGNVSSRDDYKYLPEDFPKVPEGLEGGMGSWDKEQILTYYEWLHSMTEDQLDTLAKHYAAGGPDLSEIIHRDPEQEFADQVRFKRRSIDRALKERERYMERLDRSNNDPNKDGICR